MMKVKYVLIILLSLNCYWSCSQDSSLVEKVTRLKDIKDMPYLPELSGDSLFWVVVQEKLKIVHLLIECLDDTTLTQANVANFGGFYTVADIAYQAISEIIKEIPTMDFVVKSNNPAGGYLYYWDYVRSDSKNRISFQNKVRTWFKQNESNLEWKDDPRTYRTSSDWKFPTAKHPSGGYYVLKDE